MAHLRALAKKFATHAASSEDARLLSFITASVYPAGLIYIIAPDRHWTLDFYTFIPLLRDAIFLLLLFNYLGISVDAIRSSLFEGGPETFSDTLRNAGVVPEVIITFATLTVALVVLSAFSYHFYFLLRRNIPIWERRGVGSYMLYVNVIVSALEIISASMLIKFLNSVPDSLLQRSGAGGFFYVPAYIGLLSAGSSVVGIVLMVAGPSRVRLPDTYEPIAIATDHPYHAVPSSSAGSRVQTSRGTPQSAENQSLAAVYQAQKQQRQQLMVQTKTNFMSSVVEGSRYDQLRANSPDMAEPDTVSGTLTTKFDNGTAFWSKYNRSHVCHWFIIGTGGFFVINGPIQISRFIRHWRRNRQDCRSLCYLDLITPFLGLPIPIVLLITLCYRVDLEQRVWPHAPSSRALVLSYCFSTLAVYITDLVFLVIRKPFDGDIFIDGTNYLYVGFMGLGLVILFCTGVAWLRSMYHNGPDYTIRL